MYHISIEYKQGGTIMWSISELKQKGKISFKRNYWKTVLVSILFVLVAGGISGGSYGGGDSQTQIETDYNDYNDFKDDISDSDNFKIDESILDEITAGQIAVIVLVFLLIFFIVFSICLAIGLAINAFIINPIELGTKRFFIKNLNDVAQVKEIGFGFDNCYKNHVNILFFRDLYTVLWSLLFIIPGIVKSYEYRMIPYLLAEHPDMPKEVAFAESKRLMSGNKWHAFLLDLSFIGWALLSLITAGIVGVFYVFPYKNMTNAALYEKLCYTKNNAFYDTPEQTIYNQ